MKPNPELQLTDQQRYDLTCRIQSWLFVVIAVGALAILAFFWL